VAASPRTASTPVKLFPSFEKRTLTQIGRPGLTLNSVVYIVYTSPSGAYNILHDAP